ncbi:MAG TPA: NUDIX hydrolase [Firmicutes bacterium]|nr:NUDIX hydrolase [Bacillota bacterium]
MQHFEKKISSEQFYKGRIISMYRDQVELENGKHTYREYVTHPGGVCIAALTEDQCIYMVRQFRYPYGEMVLELPAGKREPGEDPLVCGKRELTEETGMQAAEYISLGELYPSPGYTDEVIYMYLAVKLEQAVQRLDEDEFLDVEKIPLDQAVQMILRGEIKDAKTQAAILKVKYLLEQQKQEVL